MTTFARLALCLLCLGAVAAHAESPRGLQKLLEAHPKLGEDGVLKEGLEALLAGDGDKASKAFNTALTGDPTNTWLHTLNGMAYQLKAAHGDVSMLDIAEAGFLQAIKFDPSNSLASLQLGRVKRQQKNYIRAQGEFANVLLLEPNNQDALYELACVSYLRGDLKTAQTAVGRLLKLDPQSQRGTQAAAMIFAAAGKTQDAHTHLIKARDLGGSAPHLNNLYKRTLDWQRLYDQGMLTLAQADTPLGATPAQEPALQEPSLTEEPSTDAHLQATLNSSTLGAPAPAPAAAPAPAPVLDAMPMIVLDSVIMRVSETGGTQKGNNILENFSVTLAPGTHLYARGHGVPQNGPGTGADDFTTGVFTNIASSITSGNAPLSVSRLFTQGISFGSIVYSMNIANSSARNVEVLTRPSVTTLLGKTGHFFSGTELILGLAGQFSGSVVKTPAGITMDVTPVALEGDIVTLEITILATLPFDERVVVDVTKNFFNLDTSSVRTTVKMKLGETLMLGGINTRVDQDTKTGLPVLQDLPGIQYLTSKETTSSDRKSVTFLITPHLQTQTQAEVRAAFANEKEGPTALTELEMRNKDWFAPYSQNQTIIFKKLAPLYREFRTSDLSPVDWFNPEKLEDELAQIGSFLYY